MLSFCSLDRSSFSLFLVSFLLIATVACDNSIEPYSDEASYSVYGYLSLNRHQQFVRVKPLNQPLSDGGLGSLDVDVTLENLEDGSAESLQDSVIVFEDQGSSIVTHNFWTDAPIKPNSRYRLTVNPSEQEPIRATTTTPSNSEAKSIPQEGHCKTSYTIEFPDIQDARFVRAVIEMKLEDRRLQFSSPHQIKIHDGGTAGRPDNAFLAFEPEELLSETVDLQDDPETECLYEHRCLTLERDQVTVRYTYLGPDWYGEVPDTLEFNPLESIHVENGRGFFGSAFQEKLPVTVNNTDPIPIDTLMCP